MGICLPAFGEASGVENAGENGQTVSNQLTLRVLTLNIHSGIDWQNRFNLDGLAQLINDLHPDVVGLQEVDRFWSSMSQFKDIPGELALRTKLFSVFSVSRERNNGFFGNLILSKYPIVQMWAEAMPGSLERRSYIYTQLNVRGFKINFITTHLGLSVSDRLQQVDSMFALIKDIVGPLIIVGDLNGDSDDPAVRLLRQNFAELQDLSPYKGQGTFRGRNGIIGPKIDYIFVTPEFEPVNFQIIDSYVSDHLPVLAEVHLQTGSG